MPEEENADGEGSEGDGTDNDASKDKTGASVSHASKSKTAKSRLTGTQTQPSEMQKRAKEQMDQSARLTREMDQVTFHLNKLCRNTPEGYMITIQQRQFEGRETAKGNGTGMNESSLSASKSMLDNSQLATIKPTAKSQIGQFSKEVEKIF